MDTMAEDFSELVVPWLTGELSTSERAAFAAALERDPALAEEVAASREALALMALATPTPPSHALRERVLALGASARMLPMPSRQERRSPGTAWLGLGLAASLALAAATTLKWQGATTELARVTAVRDSVSLALAERDSLLALLSSPELESVRLVDSRETTPSIRVLMDARRRRAIVSAAALPPLAPDRDYQLWYIVDGTPVASVAFHPAADGSALALDVPMPERSAIQALAITVERTGGSPTPTTPAQFVTPVGE
jgi:anti-sigma-K factor RskA